MDALGSKESLTENSEGKGLGNEGILVSSAGVVDKYANVVATGHKLLVRPDPSNILVAFKPTIEFNEQMELFIGLK